MVNFYTWLVGISSLTKHASASAICAMDLNEKQAGFQIQEPSSEAWLYVPIVCD